jgi:serine/threonine protein kinase
MKNIGKYAILGELGKGGTGVVYKAIDPILEREVAIKKQIVEGAEREESIQRFLREARLIANLKHRNIVTVFDLGQDRDGIYIVMELLHGEDLSETLRSRRLSFEQKLRILSEVGAGLAHAHRRGVVHRDVKPRNVFLTEDGEVKLLDFGLAHIAQSTLTVTGQVMGSPHYMSPEQILGNRVDVRSDVFSLGSLFYEVLTGRKAFLAPSLPEVFDRILGSEPEPIGGLAPAPVVDELSRILARMLRKRADDRYPNIDELLVELRRLERRVDREKAEIRDRIEDGTRKLKELLARRPPPKGSTAARLLATAERDDLSFLSLMGLRDGIEIELFRMEADSRPPDIPNRGDHAEAAYEDARVRFARGDLGGSLVRVSEALRARPDHRGALALSEKVREAVVERASWFENESEADLDVLVAAYLAFDRGPGDLA